MTGHDPFDARPDAALGRLLREHLDAGDDAAFRARIEGALRSEADSSWTVLARWEREAFVETTEQGFVVRDAARLRTEMLSSSG